MSAEELRKALRRGIELFRSGRFDESHIWFDRAAMLAPDNAEAHAWLAAVYGKRIDAAWALHDKVDLLEKLDKELEQALELDPALPLARRINGVRLLQTPEMLGGDPAAAAEEFRYCIEQGLNESELWLLWAECYVRMERLDLGIAALQQRLAAAPDDKAAATKLTELQQTGTT